MAREVVVEVVGDARKFNQTTDQATQKAQGFGSVLSGVGAGIGLGVFNLASQGVSMFVGALDEAQQAYKDDQASQALLRQALENNVPAWNGSTDAIEEYAAAQQVLGFQDDEIRASIGQLIGITHDQTEAMELNTLAQDLARAKGIDLATATDIVTKAAQGNGRALKAMGVDIGDATDAAGMLDAIQQNVTGSAETWAATSEGQTAVAQARQAEAWEKIGKIVDHFAMMILPIVTRALEVVAEVFDALYQEIGPVIDQLMKELGPVFETIGKIAAKVFPMVVAYMKGFIGFWIEVFKIAGKIIGEFIKVVEGIASVVSRIFEGVKGAIKAAINGVIGIVNGIIRGINAIQVHIHVGPVNLDWDGLKIRQIPTLHLGGVVPGPPGSEQLALLQAGERVIPRTGGGGQPVVINFYGPVYGDDMDELARKLAMRLRTVG